MKAQRLIAIIATLLLIGNNTALADEKSLASSDDGGIAPQALDGALEEFAERSGLQVIYLADVAKGKQSPGAEPDLSDQATLDQLLASTNLKYEFLNDNTVTLQTVADKGGDSESGNGSPAPILLAQNRTSQTTSAERSNLSSESEDLSVLDDDSKQTDQIRIPEILVVGRPLNMDIPRNESDAQPFVTFDSEEIERSGAVSLDDFLRRKLPQNATIDSAFIAAPTPDVRSSVNLRGLGVDQTLVLVNGRRLSGVSSNFFRGIDFRQADINGIPLSSIERIEVLPATASAIYGGGATGGVINIILKTDYDGLELSLAYDNSFESNSSITTFEASGGVSLEEDRTQLTFAISGSSADDLLSRDRDFAAKSRALQLANNPDYYLGAPRPPLGALPNISTRPVFDLDHFLQTGQIRFVAPNLVLDDGTELGSPITTVPEGYLGASSDGGAALVANAGLFNYALDENSRTFRGGGGQPLVTAVDRLSVSSTLRRRMTDRLELYGEALYTENIGSVPAILTSFDTADIPADAPNNPFQQNIRVSFPALLPGLESETTSESLSFAAGGVIGLPNNWRANFDANFVQNSYRIEGQFGIFTLDLFDALADGTVDVIRDTTVSSPDISSLIARDPFVSDVDTVQSTISARFAGPLFELPAGMVRFNSLIEFRNEVVEDTVRTELISFTRETAYFYEPEQEQDVVSLYGEIVVPVISSDASVPFAEMLEFQAAVRYDDYSLKVLGDRSQRQRLDDPGDRPAVVERVSPSFSSTDFMISVRYIPIQGITVRSSFSTGYLPPSLSQLVSEREIDNDTFLADPQRGGETGVVTIPEFLSFGNPKLDPEKSTSFSAGLILEPRFAPQLRFSVDYVRLDKEDEIAELDEQEILDREDQFPNRIVRAPLENDAPPGFTAGVITYFDSSLANVADSKYEFMDFNLDYAHQFEQLGTISFYANATKNLNAESRILSTDEFINRVGFINGPREWAISAGAQWVFRDHLFDWSATYTDSTRIYSTSSQDGFVQDLILNQGSSKFDSNTVHDIQAILPLSRYFGGEPGSTELRVGIRNLFNEQPEITPEGNTGGAPRAFYNGVDPRLRTYYARITQRF